MKIARVRFPLAVIGNNLILPVLYNIRRDVYMVRYNKRYHNIKRKDFKYLYAIPYNSRYWHNLPACISIRKMNNVSNR